MFIITSIMEFQERLKLHLASLTTGEPLNATQLQRLIQILSENQNNHNNCTFLQLLLITFRINSKTLSSFQANDLGQTLKALAAKIQFQQPIRSLTSCNFESFKEYSVHSDDKELLRAFHSSFGLYPLSYPGEQRPSSIYLQKGKGSTNGNPHWLFSRLALKEYFRIKNSKMPDQLKTIYLFFLSDQNLIDLWKNDSFKLFWGQLYVYYNSIVLEPYLQNCSETLITWLRPQLTETITKLKQLENSLSLNERLYYFLVLGIFTENEQCRQTLSYCPFEAAFNLFIKTSSEFSWSYILELLFFNIIAQNKGYLLIEEQCARKFKILLSEPHLKEKLTPFIYFFLHEEEIMTFVHQNNLQYWKIPLNNSLKRKIAQFLLSNGVFHLKSLKYIDQQSFISSVFKSSRLQDPNVGALLMDELQIHEQQILQFLNENSPFNPNELMSDYRLFKKAWCSYYTLLEVNNLELANNALIENNQFHDRLQSIFSLPRQNRDVVFKIIIRVARIYRLRYQNTNQLPALREKIEEFQQKMLPKLLSLLNEQQCNQFWKQWSELLKNDPSFVTEIMRVSE